jgi:hypothetical protein
MIPQDWIDLDLRTSPQFLEEIGFLSIVPSAHPITVLAKAKDRLREQRKAYIERLQLKRQRYCILYYDAGDPRAYDGNIDMEVEWWGPCSDIITPVNIALSALHATLGADDASPTHALVHDRATNRWWLAPIHQGRQFVRDENQDLE